MGHAFESRVKVTQKRKAEYAALRDLPSVSVDGQPVTLLVNAGLRDALGALDTTGAEGIGLFRTEFQYLISAALPRPVRQTRPFPEFYAAPGDRPTVYRTLMMMWTTAAPYFRQAAPH